MNITRIAGPGGYESKIAMACIVSGLERQGHAVLNCSADSTTEGILQMCSSPVPFAIVLNDHNPKLVDLHYLHAEPRLRNVLCYVECTADADPNDELDDILPVTVHTHSTPRLIRESAGILSRAADSEGGEAD